MDSLIFMAEIITNSGTEHRKALSITLTHQPSLSERMPISDPSMKKNSHECTMMTMKQAITRTKSRNTIL